MAKKLTADEIIEAIEHLELVELRQVYAVTQKQIEKTRRFAQATAIQRMRDVATESGVDFEALMREHFGIDEDPASGKKRAKVPPKFMHPENPSLTWSGRGRQPLWFKEYEEQGGNTDDLLIDKSEVAQS